MGGDGDALIEDASDGVGSVRASNDRFGPSRSAGTYTVTIGAGLKEVAATRGTTSSAPPCRTSQRLQSSIAYRSRDRYAPARVRPNASGRYDEARGLLEQAVEDRRVGQRRQRHDRCDPCGRGRAGGQRARTMGQRGSACLLRAGPRRLRARLGHRPLPSQQWRARGWRCSMSAPGQRQQAEATIREVLPLLERALGSDHPVVPPFRS